MAGSSTEGCTGVGGIAVFGSDRSTVLGVTWSGGIGYGRHHDDEPVLHAGSLSAHRSTQSCGTPQPDRLRSVVELRSRRNDVDAGTEMPSMRTGFLIGSGVLAVIGVVLIALAPAKRKIGDAVAAMA